MPSRAGANSSRAAANASAGCALALGASQRVRWMLSAASHGLSQPRDVKFDPLRPELVWVANAAADSLTQANISCLAAAEAAQTNESTRGCAVARADRAGYHYMANVSAVSFENTTGWFAVCADSDNEYNGLMSPNYFMGCVRRRSVFAVALRSAARARVGRCAALLGSRG